MGTDGTMEATLDEEAAVMLGASPTIPTLAGRAAPLLPLLMPEGMVEGTPNKFKWFVGLNTVVVYCVGFVGVARLGTCGFSGKRVGSSYESK